MTRREWVARVLEQNPKYEKQGKFVNIILIGLIALNIVAIILESEPGIHQKYHKFFWDFEVFSVIVFTLEYLIRIWSSIDLQEVKDSSPVMGRIKYMLSPMALIDMLSILPFYLSLYIVIDLRILRILRMLRMFKLTRYSRALSALLDVLQKESDSLFAASAVLLMMLVLAATGIYFLENEVQHEVFGSIPKAMWWAIVTLTTLGYGDVVPITNMGKFFAGVIGLVGVGMLALPAAILAHGFAENLNQRRQKYNLFIAHYLRDGHIDDEERWELEKLRKELGLESDDALHLIDKMMRQSRTTHLDHCPHCGKSLDTQKHQD
jgi:voltage-gated potassium channel